MWGHNRMTRRLGLDAAGRRRCGGVSPFERFLQVSQRRLGLCTTCSCWLLIDPGQAGRASPLDRAASARFTVRELDCAAGAPYYAKKIRPLSADLRPDAN